MTSELDFTKVRSLINNVDLSSTSNRLVKVHHWKEPWTLKAVQQYRNYLFLKFKYGKTHSLPPSFDIDEVWHAHILHTAEYTEFCQNVFGFYLHHHPHHGKHGELTDADIAKAFEQETQKLYYLEFGEYIEAVMPLPFKVTIQRFINLVLKKNYKIILERS